MSLATRIAQEFKAIRLALTTNSLTVNGNISTTGTVDGRDIATDGTKLDGIQAGANNYSHPSYDGDDFSVDTAVLTGATVVSRVDINVTTDTSGHVTDANGLVTTRTLTASDIGAQSALESGISIKTINGASVLGSGDLEVAGSAINDVFYENAQVISSSYTITNGKNAMTVGDITINNGVTVTVPTGSRWVIV